MKGLKTEPDMNIARQRRKLLSLMDSQPIDHAGYIAFLLTAFDKAVAAGRPVPASEFIEMMKEEFD